MQPRGDLLFHRTVDSESERKGAAKSRPASDRRPPSDRPERFAGGIRTVTALPVSRTCSRSRPGRLLDSFNAALLRGLEEG